DMERSAVHDGSEPAREGVASSRSHIHRVFQPFTGRHPADVISTAGIAGGLDVHTGAAVLSAVIGRFCVVISHSFATIIKILGLECAWQRAGRATEWRGRERQ